MTSLSHLKSRNKNEFNEDRSSLSLSPMIIFLMYKTAKILGFVHHVDRIREYNI